MKSNNEILKEFDELEKHNELYNIKINNSPVWKILRFNFRIEELAFRTNFKNKSKGIKIKKFEIIKYFVISFFNYFQLILKGKKVENLVISFPRLYKVGEKYIDKFTDPVIHYSDIRDNFIVLQHCFGNTHFKPRCFKNNSYNLDFIDIFSRFLTMFLYYPYYLKKRVSVNKIFLRIKKVYPNTKYNKFDISKTLLIYAISKRLYKPLLVKLSPRNLFVVNRQMFNYIISNAKELNIRTFEFQHGITQTETPLYTGPYIEELDPDYFLAFGESWKSDFFGISKDKIINIGWAYQDYVKEFSTDSIVYCKNSLLVISSPGITQKLIDFIFDSLVNNPNLKYDIRLHPQEKLSDYQYSVIRECPNVNIINNSEDSLFTILKYNNIIGDNSSVLYEALSIGKNVGKINMNQILSRNIEEDKKNGFFIINKFEDLEDFIGQDLNIGNNDFYSKFNKDVLNKLIK